MPQPIKVDPQELAHLTRRMRDSAYALRDGHRSSAATADDAQSGLVGRSARSIDARTQRFIVHIFGECRNMDEHRDAASVNVTDQVVAR